MELNVFSYRGKVFLSSLLTAVILLLALFTGASAGKILAQSEVLAQTGQNLSTGLNYFYKDQNRYPTATEFADQNTMLNYFTVFPPQNFTSKNCSQSFSYKRIDANNYSLSFCLPKAVASYQAGWNTISAGPQ